MERLNVLSALPILARPAAAEVLASDVPLSFWGGFDPDSGEIIDRRHPLAGQVASGRALVIPIGRGSCSGSGVLLESIQNGTAPAAIITSHVDPIISLGAILGDELCGSFPAILVVTDEERRQFVTGDHIDVSFEGVISVTRSPKTSANER